MEWSTSVLGVMQRFSSTFEWWGHIGHWALWSGNANQEGVVSQRSGGLSSITSTQWWISWFFTARFPHVQPIQGYAIKPIREPPIKNWELWVHTEQAVNQELLNHGTATPSPLCCDVSESFVPGRLINHLLFIIIAATSIKQRMTTSASCCALTQPLMTCSECQTKATETHEWR